MRKRVTITDLAGELSLSPATVSLVLSGKADAYRIAPATRERVEETAKRLDYRPDQLARAMQRGRTQTVGVVFPDVSESSMSRVLKGLEDVAAERDICLMIATSSFDFRIEARNIRTLLDRRVDGLILVPYAPFRGEAYDDEAVRYAVSGGTPVVAVDRTLPGILSHAVVGADYEAALSATGRLLEAGCRRLAYVGFDLVISTLEDRRRGFRDALGRTGQGRDAIEILLKERNPESGDLRGRLDELARDGGMPDGFLVSTDGLALKLKSLLMEQAGEGGTTAERGGNLRRDGFHAPLPRIARFGRESPYAPSGMITITQPHEILGKRAMEKLLVLAEGRDIPEERRIETVEMEISE